MKKRFVVAVVLAVVAIGVMSVSDSFARRTPPGGGDCLCPDVFAPVVCSNGQTYSNACVASCNGATDCVPAGDIY